MPSNMSLNMALVARSRGVCVCQALGESLPYPSAAFDSVSLITVLCFVENSRAIIDECRRVLRPGGHLLIGMIDKDSPLGALYESRKAADVFYGAASLHSVENMISLVENAGLRILRCVQTLIGLPYETPGWDDLRTGFGEGASVAMLARKPDA